MSKSIYWATPEGQLPPPNTFQAPLDAVLKEDISETARLLEVGIDPNAGCTEKGLTLLHLAICLNNLFIIYLLLSSGADPREEEENGLNSLDFAITCRRPDIANILFSFEAKLMNKHGVSQDTSASSSHHLNHQQSQILKICQRLPLEGKRANSQR